jgi:hypothetical protein
MKPFSFFLFTITGLLALENSTRLFEELEYLGKKEPFLFLPKREMLFETTEEIKMKDSAVLKTPVTEDEKEGLLRDLEMDEGFRELPVNMQD